jgi:CRISPR-associated endonuclease Cas1
MVKELLNTLYVTTERALVRLDGEALRVEADGQKLALVPLHHLTGVVLLGGASMTFPALARCAADGRAVTSLSPSGKYQFRISGPTCGNILLRQAQWAALADPARACGIARNIVAGKIHNQRHLLARAARDTRDDETEAHLRDAVAALGELLLSLPLQTDLDGVRGVEGQAAAVYFGVFGELIAAPTAAFSFKTRTRRPPRDRVNALLSFLYALLTTECVAACEGVGLDPQCGYLHCLRPGRPALALDIMEEFRPLLCDRLALTLINRRQITPEHFDVREGAGESVLLTKDGRRAVLDAFRARKQEEALHPFLKDRAPLGLLPHLQARLLARHLRGDMAHYLPYVAAG